MEFLRNQLGRIQQQLAGLTASQKMLAGTLVFIMVTTLIWWTTFAGRAETVALLDQSLKAEDLARITTRLDAKGVKYRVVGDRIQVPAERRLELWADLSYSGLMPRNTTAALDEIIAKSSPFISGRQQDAIWNQLKQNALSQILREFPNVSDARVIIDPTSERGLRKVEPSAVVSITMRTGETPDNKLARAAAELVAGSVANLSVGRVKVLIDGKSYRVHDQDAAGGGGGDEWLDLVQRSERYHESKLQRQLSMYEGAVVTVSVKPNTDRVEKVTDDVDPKKLIHKPESEETTSETSNSSQRGGGEPGVVPNGPLAADETAGGETTATGTEKNLTKFTLIPSRTTTKTLSPGGELPPQTATVLIPRNHFLQEYRKRTSTTQDPDPKLLDSFISSEITQTLKPTVRTCLGLATEDAVQVAAYTDLMPALASAPQTAGSSISLLGDHAKEIALGALALVSLFLVSQIVRKGSPAPAVASGGSSFTSSGVAIPKPTPALSGSEETVGEVSEGKPLLDGMELDEDSVKAQQMLGQVSQLVDENPDAAANLIKRWLSRP